VARGEVSYTMAQVLAKAADSKDEEDWLVVARRRTVRAMRKLVKERAAETERRDGTRQLSAADGLSEEEQVTLTVTVDRLRGGVRARRPSLHEPGVHAARPHAASSPLPFSGRRRHRRQRHEPLCLVSPRRRARWTARRDGAGRQHALAHRARAAHGRGGTTAGRDGDVEQTLNGGQSFRKTRARTLTHDGHSRAACRERARCASSRTC